MADHPEVVTNGLSARQREFVGLVASGMSNVAAYKKVYKPKKHPDNIYSVLAYKVSRRPGVQAAIALLQKKSDAKRILTLNDRLAILARDAQLPGTSAPMVNARARVIEVYNKTAGDNKPERQEITLKGDPTQPLVTITRPATKAEKAAAMRANRDARKAQQEKSLV